MNKKTSTTSSADSEPAVITTRTVLTGRRRSTADAAVDAKKYDLRHPAVWSQQLPSRAVHATSDIVRCPSSGSLWLAYRRIVAAARIVDAVRNTVSLPLLQRRSYRRDEQRSVGVLRRGSMSPDRPDYVSQHTDRGAGF